MDARARQTVSELTSTDVDALIRQLQRLNSQRQSSTPNTSKKKSKTPKNSTSKPANPVKATTSISNNVPSKNAGASKNSIVPQRQKVPATKVTTGRVPPIVLRDASFWTKLLSKLKEKNLNFSKAKNLSDGITMQPCTEADYRGICHLLEAEQVSFHTYSLPSEKPLHFVLRGIPQTVSDEMVRKDLLKQGIPVISVRRMCHAKSKRFMLPVSVEVKRTGKTYNIHRVLKAEVQMELQRKKGIRQCHICQKFGHAQRNCHAPPCCVKCAGDHYSKDCPNSHSSPAVCANCAGPHTANYRKCSAFPKPPPSATVAPVLDPVPDPVPDPVSAPVSAPAPTALSYYF